jgi:hypothetical protein
MPVYYYAKLTARPDLAQLRDDGTFTLPIGISPEPTKGWRDAFVDFEKTRRNNRESEEIPTFTNDAMVLQTTMDKLPDRWMELLKAARFASEEEIRRQQEAERAAEAREEQTRIFRTQLKRVVASLPKDT